MRRTIVWHYFPRPLCDWFSRIIEHMLIYWLVRSVSQPASSNCCFNWTCQSFLNCSSKSDPASLSAICIFVLFNFYFWVPVFSPWLKLSFSILLSVLGSRMCFFEWDVGYILSAFLSWGCHCCVASWSQDCSCLTSKSIICSVEHKQVTHSNTHCIFT